MIQLLTRSTGWNAEPLKIKTAVQAVRTEGKNWHGINMIATQTTKKINMDHVGLGNTGEINNVCIEFPEADLRLTEWAKWRRDGGNLKELGYPTSSSHTRPFGSGGFAPEIPDNHQAEQVDRLVAELESKYSDIYQVLLSCYFYGDNGRDGSVTCCIPLKRYQTYLKMSVAWIDGRLH